MNTVQILGIMTVTEIIMCRENFQGITLLLWIGYGVYKFATYLFTIPNN